MKNRMRVEFDSISAKKPLPEWWWPAFMAQLNPSMEEVADVKTAVSEAVTNAIIHGYQGQVHTVEICGETEGRRLTVQIRTPAWESRVEKAMEPLYTSRPEAGRSGMGFLFMEAFMDEVQVESEPGKGTCVTMCKQIGTDGD